MKLKLQGIMQATVTCVQTTSLEKWMMPKKKRIWVCWRSLNWIGFSFHICFSGVSLSDPSSTTRCGIRSSFPNETGSLEFNVPSKILMRIGWYNSPSLLPSPRYPTPSPPSGAKRKIDPVWSSLLCTFSLGEPPCCSIQLVTTAAGQYPASIHRA